MRSDHSPQDRDSPMGAMDKSLQGSNQCDGCCERGRLRVEVPSAVWGGGG